MPAGRSFSPSWTSCWQGQTSLAAGLHSIISRGGFIDRKHVGSTDPSLAVDRFHACRHRQHRRPDAASPGDVDRLARLRPIDPIACDRTLHVRAAISRPQPRRATRGVNMKKAVTAKNSSATKADGASPSRMIDGRIKELGDWRGDMLGRIRGLIKEADPDVVEEWKWRGGPVGEHDGIICTGETYKAVVKMTFAKGAALDDPAGLFNSSLDGNVRRAIDIREGEKINEKALKALIRAAVALNASKKKPAKRSG